MNIEHLKECGVDYEDGLARFSGSTAIYEKYLKKLPDLQEYEEMKKRLASGDVDGAFESAHKLKAFVGNLSMTKFFQNLVVLTDIFREGKTEGSEELIERMDEQYERIVDAIRDEL